MKILLLYEYPPLPAGLATQGDLLYRGLRELGIETQAAHWESAAGEGMVLPLVCPRCRAGGGVLGVYAGLSSCTRSSSACARCPGWWPMATSPTIREVLNELPLILVTSSWVKQVYVRDGIRPETIEVLPVGCDTESFVPRDAGTRAWRRSARSWASRRTN